MHCIETQRSTAAPDSLAYRVRQLLTTLRCGCNMLLGIHIGASLRCSLNLYIPVMARDFVGSSGCWSKKGHGLGGQLRKTSKYCTSLVSDQAALFQEIYGMVAKIPQLCCRSNPHQERSCRISDDWQQYFSSNDLRKRPQRFLIFLKESLLCGTWRQCILPRINYAVSKCAILTAGATQCELKFQASDASRRLMFKFASGIGVLDPAFMVELFWKETLVQQDYWRRIPQNPAAGLYPSTTPRSST